jgi:uncharacterized RDD family membrane protein YckC
MTQQPPPLPPVNPYAAPTARVSDVALDGQQLELADRGARLGAVIIDGMLFGILAMVMAFGFIAGAGTFSAIGGRAGGEPSTVGLVVGSIATIALIALTVINFVWLYQSGQSVAKRWLKIRIVRTDGSRCGLARIIFLRVLPLALAGGLLNLVAPALGYLVRIIDALFIFRSDYRCLHDHIADTIVVKA